MGDRIELTGLRISAGSSELVHGVDLDLRGGELVGLVGRSGSGKSLTARSLLGMLDMQPGVTAADLLVHCAGVDTRPYATCLGRARKHRERAFSTVRGRLIGYLPQDARAALDPLARAGAQVSAAARLGGHSNDPCPWLLRAGLPNAERVARLYPHELSGGMAQRVVIAQALARGSRFLLADEPTSALDPTVQHAILTELRALCDHGIGVLLITHDLRVLPGLAHRVLIMHEGAVAETTTPSELVAGNLMSEAGRSLVAATRRVAGGVLG
ncbi:MAG: ATP-binding cassette domain-containing protein [Myxococcota bacterium]